MTFGVYNQLQYQYLRSIVVVLGQSENEVRSLITIKKMSKLNDTLGDLIVLDAVHGKIRQLKYSGTICWST